MGAAADDEGAILLAEPVRARLVQLASDVLGRMPAEEVPAPLRMVAKFTPAKRIRLGATALAAALDTDEDFRARVADAVADAAPQLVDAVREGRATPASDPVDVAVIAYLTRPTGWAALIAALGAKWADERAGRDAASEETARLRTEIAELRNRLKAEAGRVDEAAAAASAAASEEATRLRNTLRSRTGELRAAEQAVEQAHAAAVKAQTDLATAQTTHDSELRKLRARIGELERAAGTDRRDSRAGREIDDARLRLLVDTMAEAAAGIRRELALPPGTVRPADAVDAGPATMTNRAVADPTELDRLLELPQVHVILDGYNVTKTGYPELPLADQRTRLISSMAGLQARVGAEVTVVFDGGTRPPAQPRTPRGVRVLFSAPDEIADDLIRRLVAAEPSGRVLVVVTSDGEVVRDVRASGAWTVPSAVLLERLG